MPPLCAASTDGTAVAKWRAKCERRLYDQSEVSESVVRTSRVFLRGGQHQRLEEQLHGGGNERILHQCIC